MLILAAHEAASLSLAGPTRGGMNLDSVEDTFNYSQELDNYVELDEDEIALLPGEANTVCHSYTRASSLDREAMSVTGKRDEILAMNASQISALGDNLKRVCLGRNWDSEKCMRVAQDLRSKVWQRMRSSTRGNAIFSHLQQHRKEPPAFKTFRAGGGVRAAVNSCGGSGPVNLYYRHIYKSAGFAIKKNLAVLAGKNKIDYIDTNWHDQGLCAKYLWGHNDRNHKPVLFTFVRDPMDKFVAGYKEIASRGLIDKLRGVHVGSVEHAQLFLDDVFHGSCDNGHVLLQLQSMMGPACESRFDFIGKLEDFDVDWPRLGFFGGCTKQLQWPEDYQHDSDFDQTGLKAERAMRQALAANNAQLTKTLCLWLLPDYLAFDYKLPEPCRGHNFLQI